MSGRKNPIKDTLAFAVCCPNWGEPFPILETISSSPEEAIEKAIVHPDHTIWSGACLSMVPIHKGKWKNLEDQGYTVREINISQVMKNA